MHGASDHAYIDPEPSQVLQVALPEPLQLSQTSILGFFPEQKEQTSHPLPPHFGHFCVDMVLVG